ncbi:YfiR/HmsC family protein [Aliidiomarina taiwanensis]|nr:YfiR/HmsC family protein [Aliidiomarina taiwanensis]
MVRCCKQLRFALLLLFVSYVVGFQAQAIEANNISDDELRAGYLTAVMRYITWPDEPERQQLVIGTLNAGSVNAALQSTPLPRIRGMQVQLREIHRITQVAEVDVLYVGSRAASQLRTLDPIARNHNILLVTEGVVGREEVMINLISSRQSRFSFQVNTDKIQDAGLAPSENLIRISGLELEMVVAYRRKQQELQQVRAQLTELEQALHSNEQRQNSLQERVAMLEAGIEERDSVLRAQAGSLEDKQQVMDSQQTTLNRLLQELDEQRMRLFSREEQLAIIQRNLANAERALAAHQAELEYKERQLQEKQLESDALAERIAINRSTLATQQQVLRDQRAAIAEQVSLLESREETINKQRELLMYVGIGFFIALIFALLSILLYYNKRKTAAQLMQALDELHDAQDKLVEAEKMAALGNLVAGVAHEVNTPLGVALTATTMLNDGRQQLVSTIEQGKLSKSQLDKFLTKAAESLQLTERNLERVARLISNFKQVAVEQMVTERREINLEEYLEEVMSTLSIELRRVGVTYTIESDPNITMLTTPGAMAQIFTNLTTNAIRHAFDGQGGTLTIRAKKAPGDNIHIEFCDDGTGMDEEVLGKLFDPFFTTRRNDGGTGLGMSIVYNLVRQKLHGDIHVSSEPNKGTCFTLDMPRVTHPVAATQ